MTTGLRLKHVAKVNAGQSPPSPDVVPFDGEGMPFLQGNAEFGGQCPTAVYRCDSPPRIACAGALLVSVRAPVGAVSTADQRYGIGRGLAAVSPRAIHARYAYWLLLSSAGWLNSIATGSTFTAISGGDLGDVSVPLTDEREQRAVAGYLDRETAQIDAFIAKNEELITLLTVRRASVASRAIDRGFPDVSVRYMVRLIQTGPFGSQLHSEDYVPGGHPLINPMHMIRGRAVPSSDVAISDEKADELRRHELTTDDLVVARRGELGRSALITRDEVGFICGTGSMLVRPDSRRVVARYLQLAIGSERSRATLRAQSVGSTMENLNAGALSALRVPLPPIDTQREILHELDAANARIDAALATARRSIELAGERRAALISAAVTGKIDVGVAA